MDRRLSYIDANPDILDLLLNSRFALEGDAKLAEAVFGQNTVVAGFTCTPTSPASMTVNVGPGMVYQMAALESAAISALNADTHQVLKQGLSREITPLTLVAPTTVGTAVNVLIEVAYSDDKSTTQQVFNYYNAANPDVPLTGVGGNNLPQTSVVKGVAQIQTKYGIPATSGSQTTPTADPGFVPLFVVTLTQGQTAISGNIAVATGAPFVADALQNIPAGVQTNRYTYVKDTGVVNALVVAPVPALAARPEGTELTVLPKFTSTTTTPTINDGLGTVALLKRDGSAPAAGDIAAGNRFRIIFDGNAYRFAGSVASDSISPAAVTATVNTAVTTAVQGLKSAPYINFTAGTYTVTVPAGVSAADLQIWGGGGGGGGVGSANNGTASGGGGGGYSRKFMTGLTPGQQFTLVIGAGGNAGGVGGSGGAGATTTFGSVCSATGGGGGSPNGVGTGGAFGGGQNGDINLVGGYGSAGLNAGYGAGGPGGAAAFGGTGGGGAPGIASSGCVPGGGGGGSGAAAANNGTTGAPGGCLILWK